MSPVPSLPTSFVQKKRKILEELSVSADIYKDKSPKGSLDEGIRELIDEINALDGLVTTSSCAGRISVFLEGTGAVQDRGREETLRDDEDSGENHKRTTSRAGPGGKGSGNFLFTSHDPLNLDLVASSSWMDLFGLTAGVVQGYSPPTSRGRLIRFSFEPMILHIMAASLKHAQPVLVAAINAGFRESGVQSLQNLDDAQACPMVAVRTAGLGLESIIGHMEQSNDASSNNASRYEAIVSEGYLEMLVGLANERFAANSHRIARFRRCLKEAIDIETKKAERADNWEDAVTRRQRKREQGLQMRASQVTVQEAESSVGSNEFIYDAGIERNNYVQELSKDDGP